MPDFFEKHADKIVAVSESGCWIWMATATSGRYGSVKVAGHMRLAHREAFESHRGPIPSGMSVCHRCDVGFCVNPSHLFLGSHADNMRDKSIKGRSAAKLTAQDVVQIRDRLRAGEEQRAVAADYGVAQSNISNIVNRRTWRHI
jgi:hypothetical protein